MDDFDTWVRIDYRGVGSLEIKNKPLLQWCDDYDSTGSYSLGGHSIWFSNKEDATIFALRWL